MYLNGISAHCLACQEAYGAAHLIFSTGTSSYRQCFTYFPLDKVPYRAGNNVFLTGSHKGTFVFFHSLGEPRWALDIVFSNKMASYRPVLHVLAIRRGPYRAVHDVFLTECQTKFVHCFLFLQSRESHWALDIKFPPEGHLLGQCIIHISSTRRAHYRAVHDIFFTRGDFILCSCT